MYVSNEIETNRRGMTMLLYNTITSAICLIYAVSLFEFSGTMGDHPLYARVSHAMEHPETRRIYGILMLLRLLKNLLQKKSLEGGF